MKKSRPPEDPDSSKAAYLRALRWLTARELSEAQVRARLAEKGYTDTAIMPAVERLLRTAHSTIVALPWPWRAPRRACAGTGRTA